MPGERIDKNAVRISNASWSDREFPVPEPIQYNRIIFVTLHAGLVSRTDRPRNVRPLSHVESDFVLIRAAGLLKFHERLLDRIRDLLRVAKVRVLSLYSLRELDQKDGT